MLSGPTIDKEKDGHSRLRSTKIKPLSPWKRIGGLTLKHMDELRRAGKFDPNFNSERNERERLCCVG